MCCLCNSFYCIDTGQTVVFDSSCKPLVTATGSMTPSQIAAELPGQCKNGPGGATGFPVCTTGMGIKVNKCAVASGTGCQVLGWMGANITEPAQNAVAAIKKQIAALPSVWTILAALFVLFLIVIFVYGFARSR